MYVQCEIPVVLVHILILLFLAEVVPQHPKLMDHFLLCSHDQLDLFIRYWCVSAGLDPKIPEAVDFLLILVF